MKSKSIYFLLFLSIISSNCTKQDTKSSKDTSTTTTILPIQGRYSWKFVIPQLGEQLSEHHFNTTEIDYKMTGSVYNIAYTITLEQYDNSKQKIIAKGKKGSLKKDKYFVLFLKDISPSQVRIYKAEVENLVQAQQYPVPSDDNKQNHGWNLYQKNN